MDDMPLHAWNDHAGGTAWPTVVLAVVTLVVWFGAVLGHMAGLVPTWLAALVAFVAGYLTFTPVHEATHGNVGGTARPYLDTVIGWASALPLLAPFPAFKSLHLRHHAKTNHPEDDPDFWVAGTGWRVAARCLSIMPHYYATYLGPLARASSSAARTRPVAIAFLVLQALGLLGLAVAGYGSTVLFVLLIPSWLAVAVLAFFFDWLPHHPHGVQGRYVDTRAIPSKLLEVVLLGQNLHLVHHLWPSVPFYRYGAVFDASRDALAAKGAEIVERRSRRGRHADPGHIPRLR
ncbi:MAG: hypothetical protein GY913_04370 [Proteobacteria bacterium]|nr:hypothetical protein [Pseudomonadota bacterium]MCP4916136.1 hypothetical protein [Pseudomonadota bacterium]